MSTDLNLARYIDHTKLLPDVTKTEILQLCEEARTYGFASVCVPPYFVSEAFKCLEDSPVKVSTVVGFPLGYSQTSAKVEEIKRAIIDGADELDSVVNITAMLSGNWKYVRNEVDAMLNACHMHGKALKVIIETAYLNDDCLERICGICAELGVDYVKTSTGFAPLGASLDTVHRLRELLPSNIKIKASGGIRERGFALQLIEAGARRLGTSSALKLLEL